MNSIKTTSRKHIHHTRLECETSTGCLELIPEESMNCILQCMSTKCYDDIYAVRLEPGEVDITRYESFQSCVEEEIREQRKQERNHKQEIKK
jgi:hypothetical protein